MESATQQGTITEAHEASEDASNDPPKDDRASVHNREHDSNPVPTSTANNISSAAAEGVSSSKRRNRSRKRKRRKWKPYSQLTWKEKLELEKRDEIKLRKRDEEEQARDAETGEYRPPRTPRLTMEKLIEQHQSDGSGSVSGNHSESGASSYGDVDLEETEDFSALEETSDGGNDARDRGTGVETATTSAPLSSQVTSSCVQQESASSAGSGAKVKRARSASTDSAGCSYHDFTKEELIKEVKALRRRNQELEETLEAAEREITILHAAANKDKGQKHESDTKPPKTGPRWKKKRYDSKHNNGSFPHSSNRHDNKRGRSNDH
eukprot:gb/GECG01003347.1/.p1 GENE.gb/GECG01003347.1/~~gb/GECG01003347.1/.p1  ORF type:complete len:322 (+),score=63.84 gb/GECG01003347.1/:1-966(+)